MAHSQSAARRRVGMRRGSPVCSLSRMRLCAVRPTRNGARRDVVGGLCCLVDEIEPAPALRLAQGLGVDVAQDRVGDLAAEIGAGGAGERGPVAGKRGILRHKIAACFEVASAVRRESSVRPVVKYTTSARRAHVFHAALPV